jgi:hypothetical protein
MHVFLKQQAIHYSTTPSPIRRQSISQGRIFIQTLHHSDQIIIKENWPGTSKGPRSMSTCGRIGGYWNYAPFFSEFPREIRHINYIRCRNTKLVNLVYNSLCLCPSITNWCYDCKNKLKFNDQVAWDPPVLDESIWYMHFLHCPVPYEALYSDCRKKLQFHSFIHSFSNDSTAPYWDLASSSVS